VAPVEQMENVMSGILRSLVAAVALVMGLSPVLAAPAAKVPATLGLNLAGLCDWNSELPLADLMKSSRAWISQRKGTPWGKGPALALDANGWVTTLAPDCWAEVPLLTGMAGHVPAGQFVLLYQGQGDIEITNSTMASHTPGRMAFTPRGDFWLRLRSVDPAHYPKNIRVLLPGTELTYQTNPFNPQFLERWRGVSCIRFMDWMSTNNVQKIAWADRTVPGCFSYNRPNGAPVELMVDLANRLGADPWFNMPDQADDAYVRNFAALVHQRLDPSRKVYIEYSNEVWNNMFHQARYAQQKGQELHFGPIERPWEGGGMYYAHRSVELFKIWENVFGGHERLVRVLAWQAVSAWWCDHIVLPFEDAYKSADALAIAPYMAFMPSPGGKTLDSNVVATWTVDKVLDAVAADALPAAIKAINEQKAIADKYHLSLIAYEGGQHLVGVGGGENNEAITKLLQAANASPRMGPLYDTYFDAWRAAGGGTFCYFSSVGVWSKWGSWGVMQYWDDKVAGAPKFQAIARFARSCGQALQE